MERCKWTVVGKQCRKKARTDGLCDEHRAKFESKGGMPQRGPHGRMYKQPRALQLLVDQSSVEALTKLGAKVPEHPTDKRRRAVHLRGVRHLVEAYAAGAVRFEGEWNLEDKP